MLNYSLLLSLTQPLDKMKILGDTSLDEHQFGKQIVHLNNIDQNKDQHFDFAILGLTQIKGAEIEATQTNTKNNTDNIRKHFYKLYAWHPSIKILDIGDLQEQNDATTIHKAIEKITIACIEANVILVVIGGPHNAVVGQFTGTQSSHQKVRFANIDAFIDSHQEKPFQEYNFLNQIVSVEDAQKCHYTHVGFQSYFTHPSILKQWNSNQFEFYRLGYVKDNPYEIEPSMRNSDVVAIDIAAVANAHTQYAHLSTGLNIEEICLLMRFCGMASNVKTLGIYGYYSVLDKNEKNAMLIAQMLWHFVEGIHFKQQEGNFDNEKDFEMHFTTFNEIKTIFYQNKLTKRWWMEHGQNKKKIPCSYNDYLLVTQNEIPDRWLNGFDE